jgi:hypothetical protein
MNKTKEQFEIISNEISKLDYSEDNFFKIVKYLEEAIKIAKSDPHTRTNGVLNNLLQTKEKQVGIMVYNYEDESNREFNFNQIKENFIIDLYLD